ncbi:hypothetical protein V2P20_09165 [Methylobacter sp. Wu1]
MNIVAAVAIGVGSIFVLLACVWALVAGADDDDTYDDFDPYE